MDKEKLDEEFEKLWNETPASHSDKIKEASFKIITRLKNQTLK